MKHIHLRAITVLSLVLLAHCSMAADQVQASRVTSSESPAHTAAQQWANCGYLLTALGGVDNAIACYSHAIDQLDESGFSDCQTALLYSLRACALFAKGELERGTGDLLLASSIDRDATSETEQPGAKQLSASDLSHGEEQLKRMLRDRPEMANQIEPNDALWNWTLRQFAGERTGIPIFWDTSDPYPFPSDCGISAAKDSARIRIREARHFSNLSASQVPDYLWSLAVFELNNAIRLPEMEHYHSLARSGQIGPGDYALGILSIEQTTVPRTREVYVTVYLPWLKMHRSPSTWPFYWHCLSHLCEENAWRDFHVASINYQAYLCHYYILSAEHAIEVEDYDALSHYLDAVQPRSDFLSRDLCFQYHRLRGQRAWAMNQMADAVAEFSAALAIDPGSSGLIIARAAAMVRADRPRDAIAELNPLLAEDPDPAEVYRVRASAWLALGDTSKALGDFSAALRFDPADVEAYLGQAALYERQRNLTAARSDLNRAIQLTPQDIRPPSLLAELWMKQRCYRQAAASFTRVIAIEPNLPYGYEARAVAHYYARDLRGAIRDLDRAIELQPENGKLYLDRGRAHFELKHTADALRDLTKSIDLAHNDPEAFALRAELSLGGQQTDGNAPSAVEDALKSAEMTNWHVARYLKLLARAYRATGDLENALRWEEKVSELDRAARSSGVPRACRRPCRRESPCRCRWRVQRSAMPWKRQ